MKLCCDVLDAGPLPAELSWGGARSGVRPDRLPDSIALLE